VAVGVENKNPFDGHKRLDYPRYVLMMNIPYGGMTNFNLTTTVQWVNVRIHGVDYKIYLPGDTLYYNMMMMLTENLILYVASDGSTYYALEGTFSPNYHNIILFMPGFDSCEPSPAFIAGSCSYLDPSTVFDGTTARLAGAASATPSTIPFILEGDSIDEIAGINGGIIDGTTNWLDITFNVMGVYSTSPFDGYTSYNDSTYRLGNRHFTGGYSPGNALSLTKPPFVVGHYEYFQHGASYIPLITQSITTPDSWLLLYIENKGSTDYSLAGNRTLTLVDDGATTTVYLPADTIPPGEALPLYVANYAMNVAFTFYAYESGTGGHTLDLAASNCLAIGTTCPIIDPAAAILDTPAAP